MFTLQLKILTVINIKQRNPHTAQSKYYILPYCNTYN